MSDQACKANKLVADAWIVPKVLKSLRAGDFVQLIISRNRTWKTDVPLYAADNPAIVALVDCLKECADDLKFELQQRYNGLLDYPSEAAKYKRDMQPVIAARAALAPWVAKGEVAK